MPRYVRQHDEFRCGPVVILNALKWAGCNVTAGLIPKLCREVKCTRTGTYKTELARGLVNRGKRNFSVRQDCRPSLKKIEECLREGGAVLLSYWYYKEKPLSKRGQLQGHYALVTGVSPSRETFYVANYFMPDNTQRQKISRGVLRGNLRNRCEAGWSYQARAWYLKKRSR